MDKITLNQSLLKFKETLDKTMSWPCEYTYKFIVPTSHSKELIQQLDFYEFKERPSKNGNYISISSTQKVNNSDEVVEVYKKASQVEGVITL